MDDEGLEYRRLKALHDRQMKDLENENHWIDVEFKNWSKDQVSRYGKSEHTDLFISDKRAEIEAEKIRKQAELIKQQEKEEYDFFYNPNDEAELNKGPETADVSLDETPDNRKISRDYYDTMMNFKRQREEFFEEHFEAMADLIDNKSNISDQDIEKFLKNSEKYAQQLGGNHYIQLINHPDNPEYKELLEKLQEQAQKKQAEQKQIQQTIEKKSQENEMSKTKEKLSVFQQMRNKITQLKEEPEGSDLEL